MNKKQDELPKMMTPNEVAEYTNIPISIIRKMIRNETLPTRMYCRRYFVITSQMLKILGLEE